MIATAPQVAPSALSAGQYPHLPPGRAPGSQTRRRGVLGAGGSTVVLFVVLLIFGIVTAFFGLIFGLVGLGFVLSGDVVFTLPSASREPCSSVRGGCVAGASRRSTSRCPPDRTRCGAVKR